MMKKQVPGFEGQMERLRQMLIGNQVFSRCRGKLGSDLGSMAFKKMVENTNSPTACLALFDKTMADARVMLNHLAKFHRDGWEDAYQHLYLALVTQHILPGETIPLQESRPVTILMLEPEKTLLMVRWILTSHWTYLDRYLNDEETDSITKELFQQFPSLQGYCQERKRAGEYEGNDLRRAFLSDVEKSFGDLASSLEVNKWVFKIEYGQYNDHLEIRGIHFLRAIEAEQSEVLAKFNREQQGKIATWQINLPKAIDLQYFRIGLHLEAKHDQFKKTYPALTSKGVNAGLGAIALLSTHEKGYIQQNVREEFRVIFS